MRDSNCTLATELQDQIDLAIELFGFKGWRHIDPTNARLPTLWIGQTIDETWALWRCSLDYDLTEPDGEIICCYEDLVETMAELVSVYSGEMYAMVAAERILS